MQLEQTLSIIKPDAVEKNHIGDILSRFEKAGLRIAAAKMVQLTKREAEAFYDVHRARPFFQELTAFICSGPILALVLEGENAVMKNRELMGATDPQKAIPGTIRRDFAASIDENAVHGSDSLDNAEVEIDFFFAEEEICAPRHALKTVKKGGCGNHSCGCH